MSASKKLFSRADAACICRITSSFMRGCTSSAEHSNRDQESRKAERIDVDGGEQQHDPGVDRDNDGRGRLRDGLRIPADDVIDGPASHQLEREKPAFRSRSAIRTAGA